jgi:hypothetical protein
MAIRKWTKEQQRSIKHTHKTNNRVTRTILKTEVKDYFFNQQSPMLMCAG